MLKWTQQKARNDEIPDLGGVAQVSALLDLFGGTQGAILLRGASEWGELPSPGGTSQFLRADGSYAAPPQQTVDEDDINLSDVLTNNVSTARHGFAPKLPNDATKYLDGTGQYSVPAGGGGGTGVVYGFPQGSHGSNDTGGFATLTNAFVPLVDFQIDRLVGAFNAANVGDEYSMFVAEIDFSGNIQNTVATASMRFETTVTGNQQVEFPLASPVALSAGTPYIVALVITSGSGSTACRAMRTGTSSGYVGPVPINVAIQENQWGSQTRRYWYTQNSDAPTSGSPSNGSGSDDQYSLGFGALLT
jgi:hypothetical protein